METSAKEKISFRITKQLLNEIDEIVQTSDNYSCRSDFIRDVICRNNSTILNLQNTGLLLHSKTFKEIIKQLQPENLTNATQKTAKIIHSILQENKQKSLEDIRDLEVLSFVSELYQATNIVNTLNYKIEKNNVIMCINGENLNNPTYAEYVKQEITNVMKPWFKIHNISETPGNLVLTFKINNQ